ncbi:MAG: hypothetical protein HY901_19030 [Deltaproteobacteria bacterium]|nr:hypothetical protein [Deltaproteobacteria bacterium]
MCGSDCCSATESCVNSVCVVDSCTPACSGTTPVCEGTTCKCNQTSCGDSATCTNGVCVPVSTCPETACGTDCCQSAETCVEDVCVGSNSGTCTVASTYGTVTVTGRAEIGVSQSGDAYAYLSGPLPTSDGTDDVIQIELIEGYGAFTDGLVTGAFSLEGDELNYGTCGICVTLQGDVDPTAGVTAFHMVTGGSITITSVSGSLIATLTNATFEEVTIDPNSYESFPVADGCTSAMRQALFHGIAPVGCDPLNPTACTDGQGCFYDGSGLFCSQAGTAAPGQACSGTVQCVAGAQCLADRLCHSWCDRSGSNPCTGDDYCTPATSTGILGICAACPEGQVCGSACCASTQTCTDGVCGDPVPCDPLDAAACGANQGCYYDADTEGFACAAAGQVGVGAECEALGECVPGAECFEDGSCHELCDPTGAGACATTDRCEAVTEDGALGACFACPAESVCGTTCCGEHQICNSATIACEAPTSCDPLAPAACTNGQGCYVNSSHGFICGPPGAVAVGAACTGFGQCVPGAECLEQACHAFCDPADGSPACEGTDRCEVATSDGAVGSCFACPADQICGNVCCTDLQVCDASTACVARPPPPNDACGAEGANATVLTLDAAAITGTTIVAANDYGTALSAACDATGPATALGPDSVFVYRPAADGDFIIVLEPEFDAVLWYTTGSCGVDADCVTASDSPARPTEMIRVNGAIAGTDYYVYVDGYGAADKGEFTILVQSPAATPVNDKCDGATVLTFGAAPLSGDTTNAISDYGNTVSAISAACAGLKQFGLEGEDVVYSYTPQAAGPFTVTVTGSFDSALWYMTGSCGDADTCVAGADNGMTGQDETLTVNGVAGTTYYFVVDSFNVGRSGAFTIKVR